MTDANTYDPAAALVAIALIEATLQDDEAAVHAALLTPDADATAITVATARTAAVLALAMYAGTDDTRLPPGDYLASLRVHILAVANGAKP